MTVSGAYSTAATPRPGVHEAADAAREAIDRALAEPALRELAPRAERAGLAEALGLLASAAAAPRPARPIDAAVDALAALRARLAADGVPAEGASVNEIALERLVLLRAAHAAADRVPSLPVDRAVQRLFYDEFRLYAEPKPRQRPLLALGTASFRAACELVALVRFPAGQYHWDVSGLSRRMLLDVAPRDLPRVLALLAFRMRGVAPTFFPHVNAFRRNPFVWIEAESNQAFHRMARALALQPHVRGLVTRAWFHDPDLGAVSPHLAWTNRIFLENGGLATANGPADDDPDVRANNAARRQAVAEGRYRPRYGLVLWPRAAMLDWAARHPEFAE